MLIDSRHILNNRTIETDLCIIGSGAAGLTIAKQWLNSKTLVLLLESGGFDFDRKTQYLYDGRHAGTFLSERSQYLLVSRLRYFGGSTNHWGGYCRPLDEIDFEKRPWVPNSGWPFPKSHLEPYYRRALPLLEIEPFDYDIMKDPRAPLVLRESKRILTKMIHISPPTRFGIKYRDEIVGARNINLYLHGNCVELLTNPEGTRVTKIRVASLKGNNFWIKSKMFVLATGGIENPRLLLHPTKAHQRGLGNHHDLVGRYFMEHITMSPAQVFLTVPRESLSLYLGLGPFGLFVTSEQVQRKFGLLAFSALVTGKPGRQLSKLERKILKSAFDIDHLKDQNRSEDAQKNSYISELTVVAEQAPNRESRVTLTQDKDLLGRRMVSLNWQVQKTDYSSIKESLEILGRELGRSSLGRIRINMVVENDHLTPSTEGGNHHMGTTRMHVDPKQGVVDPDCLVHGVSNFYIAGSSVFPTVGSEGSTTLTLVALALRLSDHLKRKLNA